MKEFNYKHTHSEPSLVPQRRRLGQQFNRSARPPSIKKSANISHLSSGGGTHWMGRELLHIHLLSCPPHPPSGRLKRPPVEMEALAMKVNVSTSWQYIMGAELSYHTLSTCT